MAAREDPQMAARAQERALAAIDTLKAQRVAEGVTEAEMKLAHDLAESVLVELMENLPVTGVTKGGRLKVPMDAHTSPNVEAWVALRAPLSKHTVEGGPWIGAEF